MLNSQARGPPPEIWRNIFQHTMYASSADDFMMLEEYEYRYFARLPWFHYYALPLIKVCKEWQALALPLLYEHIYFQTPLSLGRFEALIAKRDLFEQTIPATYVKSIYIQLDECRVNSLQMLSILSRLPNLRILVDLSDELEGGSFSRICPVVTPLLQVLNIEVHDAFSFALMTKLQNLRELSIAVVTNNDSSWVSSDLVCDLTLPHLNYLNVYTWSVDDDATSQTHRWLVSYLARCFFPVLRKVRLDLKWDHDSDDSLNLRPFFDRHPNLVDVNFPVHTEAAILTLPHSLPVTSVTFAEPLLLMESVRSALALESLPRSVRCIKLKHANLRALEDLGRALLALPTTGSLQVKDIWIHGISSDDVNYTRFTWYSIFAREEVATSSEMVLFGTLSLLSTALMRRRPHPIRLLDSDGKGITVGVIQHT